MSNTLQILVVLAIVAVGAWFILRRQPTDGRAARVDVPEMFPMPVQNGFPPAQSNFDKFMRAADIGVAIAGLFRGSGGTAQKTAGPGASDPDALLNPFD